ncbi:6-phosphogluconolactonase [Ferrigenium kumadai]|uniref:6-phosphogluconolactonase n=1 Tax=Ferrigenium kumadai TaxID=1682490 RepID=A0AAN1W110_9PROT|nr:6-phosphogluconolactonase [Ferrigenium kumadai]BBJ00357.1 6-phosphogluconolactonase [Ferrigenium kumadai]
MDASQTCRWHEFDSSMAFEQAACRFILENAERAIAARGAFRIVLSGGDTPRNIYRALRDADTDWSAWHIYFGDERCLPAEDPERNSHMARSAWLDHVAIPPRQIHPISGELGPDAAAASYAQDLAEVGEFDLVLLGLGEDGHTASLFPATAWEHMKALSTVVPVLDAPKPPSQRVSLSAARLSRASSVLFLVSGKDKREAVMNWQAGVAIPASRICPPAGVDIFLSDVGDLPTPSDKPRFS